MVVPIGILPLLLVEALPNVVDVSFACGLCIAWLPNATSTCRKYGMWLLDCDVAFGAVYWNK